jgi:hypothetical protein
LHGSCCISHRTFRLSQTIPARERKSGGPVGASVNCWKALCRQIDTLNSSRSISKSKRLEMRGFRCSCYYCSSHCLETWSSLMTYSWCGNQSEIQKLNTWPRHIESIWDSRYTSRSESVIDNLVKSQSIAPVFTLWLMNVTLRDQLS